MEENSVLLRQQFAGSQFLGRVRNHEVHISPALFPSIDDLGLKRLRLFWLRHCNRLTRTVRSSKQLFQRSAVQYWFCEIGSNRIARLETKLGTPRLQMGVMCLRKRELGGLLRFLGFTVVAEPGNVRAVLGLGLPFGRDTASAWSCGFWMAGQMQAIPPSDGDLDEPVGGSPVAPDGMGSDCEAFLRLQRFLRLERARSTTTTSPRSR